MKDALEKGMISTIRYRVIVQLLAEVIDKSGFIDADKNCTINLNRISAG